ncbi:hypothetical protein QYE76_041171 [Lolium multiflorum]|uniref:Retrotransposon gag domain-containing protein n=1 Tax=Lolium multiflorum TaxID=4521 RepID=A0AAD8TE78_LOLMU|nr:hypothetical protein QYE76_041171 [Lolium multiflorum]
MNFTECRMKLSKEQSRQRRPTRLVRPAPCTTASVEGVSSAGASGSLGRAWSLAAFVRRSLIFAERPLPSAAPRSFSTTGGMASGLRAVADSVPAVSSSTMGGNVGPRAMADSTPAFDEDIPTSLLPLSLPMKMNLLYEEETSIARGGEEQLDVKLDMELDMELDMKISHGRAREGGRNAREEKKKSRPVQNPVDRPHAGPPGPGPVDRANRPPTGGSDNKIVNQENKNSADIITWREYEALRNEMRREFRTKDDELKGTVDEIKQTLEATNVTVTGLADQVTDIQRNIADMRLAIENLTAQQQQQDDDEDPELEDDAHNARGAPRGHRPRGWVPLGRNGRGQDEEDGLGKPKFSIPKFEGGADVEEYLTWELKIEKLWSLHPHYSEDRKIKLASSEFDGYALRWWDSLVRNLDEDGAQPIRTWRAMKEAMTSRFVPTNYMRNIFDKLTLLRQGVKTVDEYYMEMEMLMQRGRVRESLEMTMQRFLNGLKYDVKGIVRHYTYTNMNQLLHHAREVESQLAEEAKVKGRATGAGRFTPRAPYGAGAFDALRSLLYSA